MFSLHLLCRESFLRKGVVPLEARHLFQSRRRLQPGRKTKLYPSRPEVMIFFVQTKKIIRQQSLSEVVHPLTILRQLLETSTSSWPRRTLLPVWTNETTLPKNPKPELRMIPSLRVSVSDRNDQPRMGLIIYIEQGLDDLRIELNEDPLLNDVMGPRRTDLSQPLIKCRTLRCPEGISTIPPPRF